MPRSLGSVVLALPMLVAMHGPASAAGGALDEAAARALARDAYIYGYPLVLMDTTRRVMTNVPAAQLDAHAPANQISNVPIFPTPDTKTVVSPNADTLYTIGWLDLAAEPMVIHVPDTAGRYYVFQLLDGWTDVFGSIGKRTTGTGAGDFLVAGPSWAGTPPSGVTVLRSSTTMAWLIGRTQADGFFDFPAVWGIQAGYRLTPLSAYGTTYTPPTNVPVDPSIDGATPAPAQVANLDPDAFFARLAALLVANPPAAADAPMIANLKLLGIEGGKFDPSVLGEDGKRGLLEGVPDAKQQIQDEAAAVGLVENRWYVPLDLGAYGTRYLERAAVASFELGVNLPEDAVYAHAATDAAGAPLDGANANRYVIHFAAGQTPPVGAFWSVTMYTPDHYFAANSIQRYAIGDRSQLVANADGSIDIFLQNDAPTAASQSANWLPAPAGPFNLMFRMYWPKPAILDGTWRVPAVTRATGG
jgi:hypothetical protein